MERRKIDLSFLGMGEGKKSISSKIFKAMKKKIPAGLCSYLHLSFSTTLTWTY